MAIGAWLATRLPHDNKNTVPAAQSRLEPTRFSRISRTPLQNELWPETAVFCTDRHTLARLSRGHLDTAIPPVVY